MTLHKDVYLKCDGYEKALANESADDCEMHYGLQVTFATISQARQIAEADGWINQGSDDFCPHCK